jgi:hypothetical protein
MSTPRMKTTAGLSLLGAGLLASAAATAAAPRGGLLCAIAEARECGARGECSEADLVEANFPRFLTVDLVGQRLHGTRPDGTEASSVIRNSFRQDDRVMLTGVENGRGWSVVLGEDGSFVLAASDLGTAYTLFGYCTQR